MRMSLFSHLSLVTVETTGGAIAPSMTELLTIVAAVFLHCSIHLIHNPTEGPTSTSISHPLSVCLPACLPLPPSLSLLCGRRRSRASEWASEWVSVLSCALRSRCQPEVCFQLHSQHLCAAAPSHAASLTAVSASGKQLVRGRGSVSLWEGPKREENWPVAERDRARECVRGWGARLPAPTLLRLTHHSKNGRLWSIQFFFSFYIFLISHRRAGRCFIFSHSLSLRHLPAHLLLHLLGVQFPLFRSQIKEECVLCLFSPYICLFPPLLHFSHPSLHPIRSLSPNHPPTPPLPYPFHLQLLPPPRSFPSYASLCL